VQLFTASVIKHGFKLKHEFRRMNEVALQMLCSNITYNRAVVIVSRDALSRKYVCLQLQPVLGSAGADLDALADGDLKGIRVHRVADGAGELPECTVQYLATPASPRTPSQQNALHYHRL
jgi:hypothetical protein